MSEIKHYGMPRRSGRYPWGSGENPYQSDRGFLSGVKDLRSQGYSDSEIAKGLGLSLRDFRARITISNAEVRRQNVATALKLKDKGYSNTAIGKRMGINESSVRSLLDPTLQKRSERTMTTANILEDLVKKYKYIDVGKGVERHMGISDTRLKAALAILKQKGYKINYMKIEQMDNPGKFTSMQVLTKDDTPYREVFENLDKIRSVNKYSEDGGRSYLGIQPPKEVSRDRIKVVYAEDGGSEKDGVIELRRNVDDLSLGGSRYAQVRIAVEGGKYMKGMAIYSDNMPDGVDILYNTTKKRGSSDSEVFKTYEDDPDNPFGSIVRQKHYIDKNGKEQLSALNIMGSAPGSGEEGSWDKWSRALSSQVLSKQSPALAKKQLELAYMSREEEYREIQKLTNPTIRKYLLLPFADECDSAAEELKAAALPRQRNQVLLPVPSMKDTEVYAPNFRNGEKVVLIRHPHGGIFEIPELTVNNRNPEAIKIMGTSPKDAIGINPKVAAQLSGADFDGDTVLVIPNSPRVGIKTSSPLQELKNFDPHEQYKGYEGMDVMKKGSIGRYMGDISNLITDMTIKGANEAEIAKAVKHSMVVIDAYKHKLDYKQSYIDNDIAKLKEKYQGASNAGAATLISKSKAEKRVPERVEGAYITDPVTGVKRRHYIDPKTGEKLYTPTGATYVDKQGRVVEKTTKTTNMAEVRDAHELSSGTRMETIYADHANKLKALANKARKDTLSIEHIPYSPSAYKTYAPEVASLNAKLNVALKNAPLERQAQAIANVVVRTKKKDNPDMSYAEVQKVKTQALIEARRRVGANKQQITNITPREWEAIQAGAISPTKLTAILQNSNPSYIKELAMPRPTNELTNTQISRIKIMLSSGYTQSEIADALGISTSTISQISND